MDLSPSETEEAVRAASEAYLRDEVPLEGARSRPASLWAGMAGMGWFGVTLAEDEGGIGMSYAGEALVFAELGRHLAPLGAVAAAIAARMARDAGDAALSERIISGGLRIGLALADGTGRLRVFDAQGAQACTAVASPDAALYAIPDGPEWAVKPCLDPSTTQAVIETAALRTYVSASGPRAGLHQMLLTAAYALGAAEAARDMASAYAATRQQFGRPIGAFQGVKHPCADMAVRCSAARAQLLYAGLSLQEGAGDAAFQVAAAKRLADMAAVGNARANVQVHGGIGMTDEAHVHLVLKRAHLLQLVSAPSREALLG